MLQSTPENEQQHVYNEVEGHEHQYSDFSPDIADDTVTQKRVEEKLHAIQMQQPALQEFKEMVNSNLDVFLLKDMKIDVRVKVHHRIETTGLPFKEPPQRVGNAQREILIKEVSNMIRIGVIRKSKSPWASRLLVVKKPDGSWRPCVDYRRLNAVTKTDSYPLPHIDVLLARLGGAKLFSKFDSGSCP